MPSINTTAASSQVIILAILPGVFYVVVGVATVLVLPSVREEGQ
jgi:hypothetical protein